MNTITAPIIQKWYERLDFLKKYDEAFYAALNTVEVLPTACVEEYDKNSEDGIKNLLHYLYFCEETERRFLSRGIPEDILLDTLSDLVIWTNIWSEIKGELYLGELGWLAIHLSANLFKLGRLQFAFADCPFMIPGNRRTTVIGSAKCGNTALLPQEDCL